MSRRPEEHRILFIVTSYKDKNFVDFLQNTYDASHPHCQFEVYESSPIIHDLEIKNLKFNVGYDHKIWDAINSPVLEKCKRLGWHINEDDETLICFITPDTILSKDWYKSVIEFLDSNPNTIVSGNGKATVKQKDYFSYSIDFDESEEWNLNQIVTKNFMAGYARTFKGISGPSYLKYNGEDEAWTLEILSRGVDIWGAPSSLYIDTKNRSIETTYHTWSVDHNYNAVVGLIKGIDLDDKNVTEQGRDKFLKAHSIDPDEIYPLPYQTNDVDYDPYQLKMHGVDARRFISGVKAIY